MWFSFHLWSVKYWCHPHLKLSACEPRLLQHFHGHSKLTTLPNTYWPLEQLWSQSHEVKVSPKLRSRRKKHHPKQAKAVAKAYSHLLLPTSRYFTVHRTSIGIMVPGLPTSAMEETQWSIFLTSAPSQTPGKSITYLKTKQSKTILKKKGKKGFPGTWTSASRIWKTTAQG